MKKKILSLMLGLVLIMSAGTYSFAEEIPVKPTEPETQTEESVNEYNKEVEEYNKQVDKEYETAQIKYEAQKEEITNHNQEEQNEAKQNEKNLEKQEQKNQTESKTIKTMAASVKKENNNESEKEIAFPFKVTYHFVYKLNNGATAEKTSSKTVNNANYTGTINLPSFSPNKYTENGHEYRYIGTFEGLSKVIVKGSELTSHDIYLNADYKMVPIITMTFICKDVNGEDVISSTSNSTDNWKISQTKANNAIQNYKTYTKGSVKYTFSHWEFTNWEGTDFPIELKNVTEDLEITATAIYDKTYLYDVTGHYIYLTSLGNKENGASTVEGSGDSYSHEFRTPPDIPSQYTFCYWKNYDNGDIKYPGEEITIDKTILTKRVEFTYYAVYDFQPQVKLIYHYKEGLKDTGAKSETIDIYGNQPENLKWFYDEEGGEPIPEGEVVLLPDIIPKVRFEQDDTPIRQDVYAHYYTITWQDWNETILEEDFNVPYGETPSYDGISPTRIATSKYTYEFIGWKPEIEIVTGNMVYTAIYKESLIPVPPTPPEDPEVPEDSEEPKKPEKPENPEESTLPTTPTTTVRQIWPSVFSSSTAFPILSIPTTTATPKSNKTVIKEEAIPLTNTDKSCGRWALVNLILTILTILSWILLIILNFKENRRKVLPLLIGLLTNILAILVFIFTENITLPMILVDKWTIIMLIIFLIEFPLLFIKHNKEEKEEEE